MLKNQRRAFQQRMPEDGHSEQVSTVFFLAHGSKHRQDISIMALSSFLHPSFQSLFCRGIEVVPVIAQPAPFPWSKESDVRISTRVQGSLKAFQLLKAQNWRRKGGVSSSICDIRVFSSPQRTSVTTSSASGRKQTTLFTLSSSFAFALSISVDSRTCS
jgi:hypothetical protein